jgi:GTP-binding protein
MDLQEAREKWPALEERAQREGIPVCAISAATREGVPELMNMTAQMFGEIKQEETRQQKRLAAEVPSTGPVLRPVPLDDFSIEKTENGFAVHGKKVERLVSMTDPESPEGMERLERQMRKLGVWDALGEAGIEAGDTVRFGKIEFLWGEEM